MSARKICFVVGARPNFMKVAPVYQALAALDRNLDPFVLHTGQHYDDAMSRVFVEELGMPEPDTFLGVGSGTHGEQTAKALVGVEQVLLQKRPAMLVVAGDVNSTLAAALAASKLEIPVAHIESGLRSFDESMPEEANRRLTDHLSRLLFVHSESGVANLAREGIEADRVHLVGNTMIDSLLRFLPDAVAREPWTAHRLAPDEYALVTLHRPALVDDPLLLEATVAALARLARHRPVLFPVHPRTSAKLTSGGFDSVELHSRGVIVCPPLGYLDFLGLESRAAFVVTDSGGVQEETSALGVRCFTLRANTERPVTIELGTNVLLGADPDRIDAIPGLLEKTRPASPIPLWDGHAGARAARVIARAVAGAG